MTEKNNPPKKQKKGTAPGKDAAYLSATAWLLAPNVRPTVADLLGDRSKGKQSELLRKASPKFRDKFSEVEFAALEEIKPKFEAMQKQAQGKADAATAPKQEMMERLAQSIARTQGKKLETDNEKLLNFLASKTAEIAGVDVADFPLSRKRNRDLTLARQLFALVATDWGFSRGEIGRRVSGSKTGYIQTAAAQIKKAQERNTKSKRFGRLYEEIQRYLGAMD